MRPKARRRRLKTQFGLLLLGAMGVLAVGVVRHVVGQWPSWRGLLTPKSALFEGLTPELEARLSSAWDPRRPDWEKQASELLLKFAFLQTVETRRLWLNGEVKLSFRLRNPVGRLSGKAPAGRGVHSYLGDEGTIFQAPDGLYAEPLPSLDLKAANEEEWKALAQTLAQVKNEGLWTSPIRSASFSGSDGWVIDFTDGTSALWGSLQWTAQKLARLKAVLDDARRRPTPGLPAGAPLLADLRYFEDGRILLRAR